MARRYFFSVGVSPIESYPEKTLVKGGNRLAGGLVHIGKGDRTVLRNIPGMLPPFLQEVWISMGMIENAGHCLWRKIDAFIVSRFQDCPLGFRWREGA